MSLMNDALRKKNRELAGEQVAPGFSAGSRRPTTTRKWVAMPVAVILITITALTGIHLLQSKTGNALSVSEPPPGRSSPDVPHADRVSSTPVTSQAPLADIEPATVSPETESVTQPIAYLHPTTGQGIAEQAIPADTDTAPAPRPHKPAAALAVSNPSATHEAPGKPARKEATVVSRSFEPGPDQDAEHQVLSSPAPGPSLATEQPAAVPASDEPTAIIHAPDPVQATHQTQPVDAHQDLFYHKALTYHRSNRLAEAIRLYRKVLRANPTHPGAMLNLSGAYMQRGNYADATPLLSQLAQATPRPQGVLLNQAIAAIGRQDPEMAIVYLDRATAASDASPWEIRFHRAVALARMNRHAEALVLYRTAEMEHSEDPLLQFNLAVTCDTLGRYPEALTHYQAVLNIAPEPSGSDRESIVQRMRIIRRYIGNTPLAAKGQ